MENLVMVRNDQPVTTSLDVAKTFGKRHADVIISIRNIRKNIEKSYEFSDSNRTEKSV